ncbi:MAG: 50S ribosomal protein L32 [Kiritimatiellae bacterium]|nr:50S ribosomal protein L32 [Kiritimatiellia bacterium]
MAVPKRKSSKSRIRRRRKSHRQHLAAAQKCPQCGAAQQPHRVCSACGHYRGRQVITVEAE